MYLSLQSKDSKYQTATKANNLTLTPQTANSNLKEKGKPFECEQYS